MKVLLVEDELKDAELIKNVLDTFQCTVSHATSLKESLSQKDIFKPDIILLDLNLPDSNRYTLDSTINTLKGSSAIIVISGDTSEPLPSVDADDYIDKQLIVENPQKFLLRINRVWTSFKTRQNTSTEGAVIHRSPQTTRAISDRDRNASLAVEQNLQIMVQLGDIEEKVDYTNGTVEEHTKQLISIRLRHQTEDEKQAALEKIAAEKVIAEQKRTDRLITAIWSAVTAVGSVATLLIANWVSTIMHWYH